MARRSRAERGFTLIEVLAALLILAAIGSGASLFFGPWRARAVLLSETRGTANWLEQVRGRAIVGGAPLAVTFAGGGSRLEVEGALEPRVQALPTQFRGRGALVFRPDGSAEGGEIELGDGARRALIRVEGVTGRVRIVEAQAEPGRGSLSHAR